MHDSVKPLLILAAALLITAGVACRKPAAAPQAQAPNVPAEAPRPAQAAQTTQAGDADKQRQEAEAAEATRKAAAAAEAACREAAVAALKDIHFDFDDSAIKESEKPILQRVADFMKKYPKAMVAIEGDCDERGTVEYNLALGERRARAALDYLTALGVPAAQLSTTSFGKEKPLCTEHVESCWSRNRRDHFALMP